MPAVKDLREGSFEEYSRNYFSLFRYSGSVSYVSVTLVLFSKGPGATGPSRGERLEDREKEVE